MKFTKVLSLVLCAVMLALSLFSCSKKAENPYGVSDEEMSVVRTFKGTDNYDEGYSIVKQDGYGRIFEWNQYDNNDELVMTLEHEYDGYILKSGVFTYANGEAAHKFEYVVDDDGKYTEVHSYLDSETKTVTVMKEDDGVLEYEEDVRYVTYDELGRAVQFKTKYSSGMEEITVVKYGPLGLESETTYSGGIEAYTITFEELK